MFGDVVHRHESIVFNHVNIPWQDNVRYLCNIVNTADNDSNDNAVSTPPVQIIPRRVNHQC